MTSTENQNEAVGAASHRLASPPVEAGSRTSEENIEVHINRRFKRQDLSWHPVHATQLLAPPTQNLAKSLERPAEI